jgi:coenzyme F420-reducing hydrogenase delta subunit
MPQLDDRELRIIGFLCNWCSYGGADAAGVSRFSQPTDLRIIRMPCTGRMDPLFALKAFLGGADGVLVSGCHPNDCHYTEGNFYARRRLEVLRRFLPILGIHEDRFHYTWVSASEAAKWQKVVTNFTSAIHELGPMPRLDPELAMCAVTDMERQAPAREADAGPGEGA